MRLMPTTFAVLFLTILPGADLRSEEPIPDGVMQTFNLMPPEARKLAIKEYRLSEVRRLRALELQGQFPPALILEGAVCAGRLGAVVESPSATLVEQLDLPRGQGVVVVEVQADSAAAKAGVKAHDILLEVDGKAVPRDLRDFDKQLEKFKDDQAVEVMLLRKGKRETIKELKVDRMKEPLPGVLPLGVAAAPVPAAVFPLAPAPVPVMMPELGLQPQEHKPGVLTTVFRTADGFTARHQEGSLIITLTGQDSKVKEIRIQDGRESNTYEVVDKVPAAYRDKVKGLVGAVEKPSVKVEVK